jgi:hypothetical protein
MPDGDDDDDDDAALVAPVSISVCSFIADWSINSGHEK